MKKFSNSAAAKRLEFQMRKLNQFDLKKQAYKSSPEEGFSWETTELLNHIDIGFFSKDIVNNKYLKFSEGYLKVYDLSREECMANADLWFEAVHPDDKDFVSHTLNILADGKRTHFEYRIIARDNSTRWIEAKVLPVIHNGTLKRVDGIVSDITQRKATEFELRKANELAQIIVNSLPGVFYAFNEQGQYKFWSKSLETVTGFSSDEIRESNPLDYFGDDEKELLITKISEVFENGKGEVEAHLLTKAGERIPYFFNGLKVIIDGEICVAGLGLNITERKKADESLQKSEEMLSHVLNAIPQAIFWKDTNSVFMGCNSVFAKASGLEDTSSIVGKNDFDMPWEIEDSKKYQADDAEVMSKREPRIHFVESQTRNGMETVYLDTTKIPLKDKDNRIYGLLGIYEDITERIQEEEKQRQINAELTRKNIDLRQFSYIISHNLRAPISKIIGIASLFEKEDCNKLNQELVAYIVNEVNNLDTVVKDLNTILAAQQIGNKAPEAVSFQDELKNVAEALNHEITESRAVINSDFRQTPTVTSVRAYIYSILYNLISNSIKYKSDDVPPIINVSSEVNSELVCLKVKDNGMGIDLEKYGDKIFGIYNNFNPGIKGGKGIGLNLVKTQAETLGGRVELKSVPGEGCEFRIFLPGNN